MQFAKTAHCLFDDTSEVLCFGDVSNNSCDLSAAGCIELSCQLDRVRR
jgi:hypothetical protein